MLINEGAKLYQTQKRRSEGVGFGQNDKTEREAEKVSFKLRLGANHIN